MSRDHLRSHVYLSEDYALEGTVLAETVDYGTIIEDVSTVLQSSWWQHVGGKPCKVKRARSTTSWWRSATATLEFADNTWRYAGPHELAHALYTFNDRKAEDRAHGAKWRGWYVVTVQAMYGHEFGIILAEGFERHDLGVTVPHVVLPPVPLCTFALPAPAVGGWRKPS